MAYARFKVTGMGGGRCELDIERSLGRFNTVAANADFERGVIEVSYTEEAVSPEQLVAAIEAVGYPVIREGEPRISTGGAKRRLPVVSTNNGPCGCG
ncbi:hypothetical protein BH24ACT20_BH24ACT20_00460 [soil metagenome]|jgi:copper chaperone CopZ